MANSKWYTNEFKAWIDRKLDTLMLEAGIEIKQEIQDKFTDPGDWRRYYSRSSRKKYHWSSRPQWPPAVDTMKLKLSIDYDYVKTLGMRTIRIGTPVKYGRYMEKGTSVAAPRPFIRPAMARYQSKFWNKINRLGR